MPGGTLWWASMATGGLALGAGPSLGFGLGVCRAFGEESRCETRRGRCDASHGDGLLRSAQDAQLGRRRATTAMTTESPQGGPISGPWIQPLLDQCQARQVAAGRRSVSSEVLIAPRGGRAAGDRVAASPAAGRGAKCRSLAGPPLGEMTRHARDTHARRRAAACRHLSLLPTPMPSSRGCTGLPNTGLPKELRRGRGMG